MKKRSILLAGAAALALLAAGPLGAQEALTLEQARSSALAHSRTLRQAQLSVDSALLAEKLQSYEMLPSLSASAGAGVSYPSTVTADSFSGTLGLGLSQTIYNGGKLAIQGAINKVATQIAREEARAEYFSVLEKVDGAFYGALEAQAAVQAAQSDLDAYRTHLSLAQAKLEAGIITRNAYLETESQTAARETTLIQSQGRLSVAEGKLASLTGLSAPLSLAAVDFSGKEEMMQKVGGLAEDGIASLIQAVYGSASSKSPALSQYELSSQKSKKEIALARADYLPSLSASFSHSFGVGAGQALDWGSSSLRLNASIPLDLWKTKASIQAADVAAKQAGLEAEDSRASLLLDIQSAVYDCISSARSAASAKKALEYAEGYYRSVLELFRLSSASSSELSDAAALASANRAALITARYSFLANLATLRSLAGLQTENELLALIP